MQSEHSQNPKVISLQVNLTNYLFEDLSPRPQNEHTKKVLLALPNLEIHKPSLMLPKPPMCTDLLIMIPKICMVDIKSNVAGIALR